MKKRKQSDIIKDSLGINFLNKNNIQFKERNGYLYFAFDSQTPLEFFKTKFDLTNQSLFENKYNQAITGSGQPERDFNALHSSALCALLCFYRIDHLNINGVIYNKSFFEVKNRVFSYKNGLSNMDVVLISEDNKTVLFLECKFSEYLKNDIEHGLSDKYFKDSYTSKLYNAIASPYPNSRNKLGVYVSLNDKKYCFYTRHAYTQGTKQIISHLKGLQSFLNRKNENNYFNKIYHGHKSGDTDKQIIYTCEYKKVIFRELLFKLNDCKQFDDYKELSKEVRKKLIKVGMGIETDEEFAFEKPITYQEIFAGENLKQLDDTVAEFYRFKKE